jgi:hypothetical protein
MFNLRRRAVCGVHPDLFGQSLDLIGDCRRIGRVTLGHL